ncbi:hypothetical protein GCM10027064_03920 [Microbacterium petrolearium]
MSQEQNPASTPGAKKTPSTVDAAKEAAAEVAGAASAEAAAASEDAAAKAEEVKEQASETAAKAEAGMKDQAATGQHRVAEGLRAAGDKVGSLAEGEGVVSGVAGKASQGLKQASEWVSNRDPDTMLTRAKSFARRKPWVVAGIGAAALLVLNTLRKAVSGKR